MFKKILSIVVLLTIFVGCQSGMNVFDKTGTAYEKGLQHTKVKPLIFEKETKAIINITYLNSVNSPKWDNNKQNFLIGIYISKDNQDKENQFIQNLDYTLTMNNNNYIKLTQIKEDDTQYKHIPLKNPWAKYYIVSFEDIDTKTLTLQYANPKFSAVSLSFEKE